MSIPTSFCSLLLLTALCSFQYVVSHRNVEGFDFAADVRTVVVGKIHKNFSCEGRPYGYYGDQAQDCQVFHICMPVAAATGRRLKTFMFSFFCPGKTRFSQDSRTCIGEEHAYPCEKAHTLYDLNKSIGQRASKRPISRVSSKSDPATLSNTHENSLVEHRFSSGSKVEKESNLPVIKVGSGANKLNSKAHSKLKSHPVSINKNIFKSNNVDISLAKPLEKVTNRHTGTRPSFGIDNRHESNTEFKKPSKLEEPKKVTSLSEPKHSSRSFIKSDDLDKNAHRNLNTHVVTDVSKNTNHNSHSVQSIGVKNEFSSFKTHDSGNLRVSGKNDGAKGPESISDRKIFKKFQDSNDNSNTVSNKFKNDLHTDKKVEDNRRGQFTSSHFTKPPISSLSLGPPEKLRPPPAIHSQTSSTREGRITPTRPALQGQLERKENIGRIESLISSDVGPSFTVEKKKNDFIRHSVHRTDLLNKQDNSEKERNVITTTHHVHKHPLIVNTPSAPSKPFKSSLKENIIRPSTQISDIPSTPRHQPGEKHTLKLTQNFASKSQDKKISHQPVEFSSKNENTFPVSRKNVGLVSKTQGKFEQSEFKTINVGSRISSVGTSTSKKPAIRGGHQITTQSRKVDQRKGDARFVQPHSSRHSTKPLDLQGDRNPIATTQRTPRTFTIPITTTPTDERGDTKFTPSTFEMDPRAQILRRRSGRRFNNNHNRQQDRRQNNRAEVGRHSNHEVIKGEKKIDPTLTTKEEHVTVGGISTQGSKSTNLIKGISHSTEEHKSKRKESQSLQNNLKLNDEIDSKLPSKKFFDGQKKTLEVTTGHSKTNKKPHSSPIHVLTGSLQRTNINAPSKLNTHSLSTNRAFPSHGSPKPVLTSNVQNNGQINQGQLSSKLATPSTNRAFPNRGSPKPVLTSNVQNNGRINQGQLSSKIATPSTNRAFPNRGSPKPVLTSNVQNNGRINQGQLSSKKPVLTSNVQNNGRINQGQLSSKLATPSTNRGSPKPVLTSNVQNNGRINQGQLSSKIATPKIQIPESQLSQYPKEYHDYIKQQIQSFTKTNLGDAGGRIQFNFKEKTTSTKKTNVPHLKVNPKPPPNSQPISRKNIRNKNVNEIGIGRSNTRLSHRDDDKTTNIRLQDDQRRRVNTSPVKTHPTINNQNQAISRSGSVQRNENNIRNIGHTSLTQFIPNRQINPVRVKPTILLKDDDDDDDDNLDDLHDDLDDLHDNLDDIDADDDDENDEDKENIIFNRKSNTFTKIRNVNSNPNPLRGKDPKNKSYVTIQRQNPEIKQSRRVSSGIKSAKKSPNKEYKTIQRQNTVKSDKKAPLVFHGDIFSGSGDGVKIHISDDQLGQYPKEYHDYIKQQLKGLAQQQLKGVNKIEIESGAATNDDRASKSKLTRKIGSPIVSPISQVRRQNNKNKPVQSAVVASAHPVRKTFKRPETKTEQKVTRNKGPIVFEDDFDGAIIQLPQSQLSQYPDEIKQLVKPNPKINTKISTIPRRKIRPSTRPQSRRTGKKVERTQNITPAIEPAKSTKDRSRTKAKTSVVTKVKQETPGSKQNNLFADDFDGAIIQLPESQLGHYPDEIKQLVKEQKSPNIDVVKAQRVENNVALRSGRRRGINSRVRSRKVVSRKRIENDQRQSQLGNTGEKVLKKIVKVERQQKIANPTRRTNSPRRLTKTTVRKVKATSPSKVIEGNDDGALLKISDGQLSDYPEEYHDYIKQQLSSFTKNNLASDKQYRVKVVGSKKEKKQPANLVEEKKAEEIRQTKTLSQHALRNRKQPTLQIQNEVIAKKNEKEKSLKIPITTENDVGAVNQVKDNPVQGKKGVVKKVIKVIPGSKDVIKALKAKRPIAQNNDDEKRKEDDLLRNKIKGNFGQRTRSRSSQDIRRNRVVIHKTEITPPQQKTAFDDANIIKEAAKIENSLRANDVNKPRTRPGAGSRRRVGRKKVLKNVAPLRDLKLKSGESTDVVRPGLKLSVVGTSIGKTVTKTRGGSTKATVLKDFKPLTELELDALKTLTQVNQRRPRRTGSNAPRLKKVVRKRKRLLSSS